ncbi:MAG TPA: IPT/TIG domain-containing protein [Bryobacteraceae bacterium]|nr:IPT/TIG domain-containing protein [Bryobacteraceae bacterium]
MKGPGMGCLAALVVSVGFSATQGPGPLYTLSSLAGVINLQNFTGDGGPAISAWVSAESLAMDREGNLYVAGGTRVRKIDASGIISTAAGPGVAGFSADGAPGTIQLGGSLGVAVDDSGALYIADTDHNRVLKIPAGGTVITIAGTGSFDSTGDGGPAVAASLWQPFGLALDRQGNLYVGEYGGNRVRRIDTHGTISTFAGTGQFGYNGDGIRATDARVSPWGLAFDDAGNLYIGDYEGYRVRKVTTDGIIHTIGGTGIGGYNGDGVLATRANIYSATGVAVDHAGNVYVADGQNQRVRKITPDGMISTVAGTGVAGILLGAGREATLSQLSYPVGVFTDNAGNLYIADGVVRKVDSRGKLTTIAGSASFASGDGGSATAAQLAGTTAIARDAAGNIYLSDTAARRIRKIDQSGVINTIAGDGEEGYAGDGVPAVTAPLNDPRGLVFDRAGNLYIADAGNNRVRMVGLDGVIHTFAGTGPAGFSGDGGSGAAAELSYPSGVAIDDEGAVYIADTGNNRIRKVSPDGTIGTIAGNGTAGYNGDGGAAADAQLSSPGGVRLDAAGNLYIADTGNHVVRKVSNGMISTVAGTGVAGESDDGGFATSAALVAPVSVGVDAQGNLFIVDRDDGRIRRVRPGGRIDTVAGSGSPQSPDEDGGPGFILGLTSPQDAAVDATGNLYIAEGSQIRKATVLRSSGFGAVPVILPQAVVNATDLSRGPVAPGELVTIFGTDLGPPEGVGAQISSGKIGDDLAGVRVLFDGVAAPVLYAQSYQINAIVPFGVTPKNGVEVQVEYSGQKSAAVSVNVAEAAPAVFTLNAPSPRGGRAAVLNQDGKINSLHNPAKIGSVVVIYATGAGEMQPAVADGEIATDTSEKPVLPVSVSFSGNMAEVLYAGPAPGIVAGVLQINARVPQLVSFPDCCIDYSNVYVAVGAGKPDESGGFAKYISGTLATIAVQ